MATEPAIAQAPHVPVPHVPVMLGQVLSALKPADRAVLVDGTFGAGGYTRAILDAAHTTVFAIDRDPTAIAAGQDMVRAYGGRLTLLEGCFGDMEELMAGAGVSSVDGVVLDIGVSSMQIDEASRGFSFLRDGPLDMRMARSGPTAADAVNGLPQETLADIIYIFGEEPKARAIARAIVAARRMRRSPRRWASSAPSSGPPAGRARPTASTPRPAPSRRCASM